MLIRWLHVLIGVALLNSTALAASGQPGATDLSEAETVAVSYMTAFFHGDVQTAANLTHQETLENLRSTYLRELDKAQAEGREQQFLEEAGVRVDSTTLRNMGVHDLYVTLVGSNQKKGRPEQLRAMQRAVVSAESSKMLNADEVAVRLKIVIPGDKGSVNQVDRLLVAKQGNLWRVKSSLP
jgi:hypothetical protein